MLVGVNSTVSPADSTSASTPTFAEAAQHRLSHESFLDLFGTPGSLDPTNWDGAGQDDWCTSDAWLTISICCADNVCVRLNNGFGWRL